LEEGGFGRLVLGKNQIGAEVLHIKYGKKDNLNSGEGFIEG
jgi:hypothetical protein